MSCLKTSELMLKRHFLQSNRLKTFLLKGNQRKKKRKKRRRAQLLASLRFLALKDLNQTVMMRVSLRMLLAVSIFHIKTSLQRSWMSRNNMFRTLRPGKLCSILGSTCLLQKSDGFD